MHTRTDSAHALVMRVLCGSLGDKHSLVMCGSPAGVSDKQADEVRRDVVKRGAGHVHAPLSPCTHVTAQAQAGRRGAAARLLLLLLLLQLVDGGMLGKHLSQYVKVNNICGGLEICGSKEGGQGPGDKGSSSGSSGKGGGGRGISGSKGRGGGEGGRAAAAARVKGG